MTRCNLPEVLAYIEQNAPLSPLHLSTVAAYMGISTAHLSRLLHRATGQTFLEHCRSCRLRRAEELLRTSNLCIKEIAWACGYRSRSTLHRDFQRVHKCSPSAWRENKRREL
jgi:AraC family transcriptional regulator